uniref:Major facilitator superfamily (MFS) profile domain-containing protein n=1 Tax=Panagrolaimus sp. JU765 TaxID=591449 RepID=A0AC34QFL1_9BILA
MAATVYFDAGFSNTYINTARDLLIDFANGSYIERGTYFGSPELNQQFDFFSDSFFIGFGVGNYLAPFMNDKFGRRFSLISMNFAALICAIIRFVSVLFFLPELLFVGRFLAAIILGIAFPTVVILQQECPPTRLRGALSASSEIVYSVMCLLGFLITLPDVFGKSINLLFGVPVGVAVVAFLLTFLVYETPKFLLIERNDREGAERSVKFYHGKNADVDEVLQNIEIEAQEESPKSSYSDLIKVPELRKAVFIGIAVLQLIIPSWGFITKGSLFLQNARFTAQEADAILVIAGVGFFFGSISCALTVEKFGRRLLLLIGSFSMTTSLILFLIFCLLQQSIDGFKYGCAVCTVTYFISHGQIVSITWFFMTELVAQHHRTNVQSVCNMTHILTVLLTLLLVDLFFECIHIWIIVPLYILPNISCFFYLVLNMPETKNQEIYEIVRKLKGTTQTPHDALKY